jgi:hypothetical protein
LGKHEAFFHPPAKESFKRKKAQPTKKIKITRITAPSKVTDPEEILRRLVRINRWVPQEI